MSARMIVAACFLGAAAAGGCSFSGAHHSTNESISVSEGTKNGICIAAVTVQESINGRKHTAHQANVPCANVSAVKSALAAQAKQGL